MHKFFSYIFFLFRSTNQHGVHSPFVYSFVTKCLYNKTNFTDYKLLKAYRSKLKYSKIELEIEDFGQGSRLMNANKRRVSKMITNSSSTFSTTKLLYRISSYFKFKNTLELGTSLGIGTQALALGNSENKVTTIEGCTNTFNFTKNNLKLPQNNQIQFINSEFKNILPTLETTHYDCIFFDGHHNKKATLDYFDSLFLVKTIGCIKL